MSKILDIIKEKAVKPEINNNRNATIGTVMSYNRKANRADVLCKSTSGDSDIILEYIPVLVNDINVKSRDLKNGDKVLITFVSQDKGIITGIIADNITNYINNKASTKNSGGNIPDYFCSR